MFCVALAGAACAGTAVPALRSGVYEGLALAVDPDGRVDGLFVQEQGEGVAKRCSFRLHGVLNPDGSLNIQSWSGTARLPGDLRATRSGVLLRLPNAREHAGCGLVLPPEIDNRLELSRVEATRWLSLRVMLAEGVTLQDKPGGAAMDGGRMPKGTQVGVLQSLGAWLEVESLTDLHERARGWVRHADTSSWTAKP